MGDGYKHYIRANSGGLVVYGFTTGFEQPITGDLLLTGQEGRHFQIQLTNERQQFICKIVNGALVSRTQAELDAEWNTRLPAPPSDDKRITDIEAATLSLMGL